LSTMAKGTKARKISLSDPVTLARQEHNKEHPKRSSESAGERFGGA
jgi:hypothetical protein